MRTIHEKAKEAYEFVLPPLRAYHNYKHSIGYFYIKFILKGGERALFYTDTSSIPASKFLYDEQPMIWLFIYVLAISLYDLRTRRIPNWYTFPLFIAGMVAHFPGHLDVWLACFALVSAWASDWMGAGDAKLWIASLWALPVESSSQAPLIMFAFFFLTGLAQSLWRMAGKQSPTHSLTLQRMDDNNRVDNPQSWDGIICWAVREDQGQIGWLGQ